MKKIKSPERPNNELLATTAVPDANAGTTQLTEDGGDFQLEEALTPEEEKDFERGKQVLAEIWPEITGADRVSPEELRDLSDDKYVQLLYVKLKPAMTKTIMALGIKLDQKILERIKKTKDKNKRAELQEALIISIAQQFKDMGAGGRLNETERDGKHINNTWSFYPTEIVRKRAVNCSGGALLVGHLMEESGIQTFQAIAPNHAFNIARLANGKLMYIDTRTNSRVKNGDRGDEKRAFVIDDYKETKIGEVTALEINDERAGYKTVMLNDQYQAVDSIVGNFGGMKSEAAKSLAPEKVKKIIEHWDHQPYIHSPASNEIATRIFLENREYLSKLDFARLGKNLFGATRSAQETSEWKNVVQETKASHEFEDWLEETIETLKFTPDEQGQLAKECAQYGTLIINYYRGADPSIDGLINILSPKNIDLFRTIKERLDRIRTENPERFEEFIKILEKK